MSIIKSGQLRADAASILFEILEEGRALREASGQYLKLYEQKDKALINEIVLGVLRYLPRLQQGLNQLLDKPLKGKQQIAEKLLLVGLYQLGFTRIPGHAAVGETVEACVRLKIPGLKGLVNGVLRNAQRRALFEEEPTDEQLRACVPKWLFKQVKNAYPEDYVSLFAAMQQKAPIWLRVNQQQISLDDYLSQFEPDNYQRSSLHETGFILTQGGNIPSLPGFDEGQFAVQDGAAQLAAVLLNAQPNDRVLDACAAPGGKTCHILERTPNLKTCVAIDSDESRLTRVQENLARLKLSAEVIAGDASDPSAWWDGNKFDRILLDAPCSALGVMRRHPDIKWLRRSTDIEPLVDIQQRLLNTLWALLNDGGYLLYATCSILPQENKQQIDRFLNEQPDAQLMPIDYAKPGETGWQILPGDHGMDGFYYALLRKASH